MENPVTGDFRPGLHPGPQRIGIGGHAKGAELQLPRPAGCMGGGIGGGGGLHGRGGRAGRGGVGLRLPGREWRGRIGGGTGVASGERRGARMLAGQIHRPWRQTDGMGLRGRVGRSGGAGVGWRRWSAAIRHDRLRGSCGKAAVGVGRVGRRIGRRRVGWWGRRLRHRGTGGIRVIACGGRIGSASAICTTRATGAARAAGTDRPGGARGGRGAQFQRGNLAVAVALDLLGQLGLHGHGLLALSQRDELVHLRQRHLGLLQPGFLRQSFEGIGPHPVLADDVAVEIGNAQQIFGARVAAIGGPGDIGHGSGVIAALEQ